MKKRGAVGVNTFVMTVAILIALVAFIFIVPKFTKLMIEAGSTGECQWNVLVSALTRTPGLGFENIPVECKARYLDVTLADIQANYGDASDAITMYGKKAAYSEILPFFNKPDSVSQLAEWSLDKVVADEMVSCWDKVWKGKLPIFDEWWKLVGYKRESISDEKIAAAEKAGVPVGDADWKWYQYAALWNLEFKHPPTFCVVCSRIKLDSAVKTALEKQNIESLGKWMMSNPVPRTKTDYFSYIMPEDLKQSQLFQRKEFPYGTAEPLAVVYQRINIQKVDAVSQDILDAIGLMSSDEKDKQVNKVVLVPYSSVILPYAEGGANCDYVID